MAYVDIPKDLTRIKTKVIFNLTARQLICFGSGALIGLPLFFVIKGHVSVSTAALIMIAVMLPFFMLGVYEKNGQPLEVIMKNYINVRFLRPKKRPYRTDNLYAAIERQKQLNKEVKAIVQKTQSRKSGKAGRKKAVKSGEKANSGGDRKSKRQR